MCCDMNSFLLLPSRLSVSLFSVSCSVFLLFIVEYCVLDVALQDSYCPIQIFYFYLRTPRADASTREPVTAINKVSIAALFSRRVRRQRREFVIRVDAA